MFRFTIRELLLVTVIVALAVGWMADRWSLLRAFADRSKEWRQQRAAQQAEFQKAMKAIEKSGPGWRKVDAITGGP